ncbi:hypothetical protein H4582DRAFT_1977644 [Lactarius indigo]|nr:hypothetical protein H4582DRAFT_1977644 [Lactarius indigo]
MLAIAFVKWRQWKQNHRTTSITVMSYADSSTESALIAAVPVDVGPQADWEQQLAHGPFFWECTPHPLPPVVSTPIGLSGKELARLRSNGLRSQPTDRQPPDLSLIATTDEGAPGGLPAEATGSSEARRLRSEVEILRHEVLQLRAERSEAPPTYASGEAGEGGVV